MQAMMSPAIKLYQYQVKSMLGFLGLKYTAIEVNPLTKRQHPKPVLTGTDQPNNKPYKKVPVMTLDGRTLTDSADIVRALRPFLPPSVDAEQFFGSEGAEWEKWSDEKLAVLLFPNLTRSFPESFQAFSYVWNTELSLTEKLSSHAIGALAMRLAQPKLKAKYGITSEREALNNALQHFHSRGKLATDGFVAGPSPTIGDIAIYGSIRALKGLNTHAELMSGNSFLHDWYRRMTEITHS